jgi:monovalent cation:H+ antiporter-2, CPA2 family
MPNLDLILTLTAGLGVALVFGFLALRFRLPSIVGYLLAGLLIGPYTPGYIANHEMAQQLAEIGVILLMFGVGLHFHLKDLWAVRRVALTGAFCEITVVASIGMATARSFGFPWPGAILFGISLSVASTVVLTRVLADNRDLHSQAGRVAVGWLIVEDIFTVFALVVIPTVFGARAGDGSLSVALGLAVVKLVALTTLTLGAGGRVIPRLLSSVAETQSRELFTLTVLVIALGISVGASLAFGVSMALGAFLAGMVVGQSEFSYRAASEALPMRDAFAVLFFVSVGMLFNPEHLLRDPLQVLITTAIVLLLKPLVAFLIVLMTGSGGQIAVRVAISLAQIGEFSFILATLGNQLQILPEGASDSLIAAAIASITINALLYRVTPVLERSLMHVAFVRRMMSPRRRLVENQTGALTGPGAVVVGYGPVGQTVCRLLRQQGIAPTVIELNAETVRRLNQEGIRAIYGDATHPDILREAGVPTAVSLVLTPPVPPHTAELIGLARRMNPMIGVLVRCAFLSQVTAMRKAGADLIFSGEAEVAMAMTEYMLKQRGATPEQMDTERRRIRRELYGLPPKRTTHPSDQTKPP